MILSIDKFKIYSFLGLYYIAIVLMLTNRLVCIIEKVQ